MKALSRTTLIRLIPAGVVAGVLALSYSVQPPALASSGDVGYGYANNCGVKGDGFHDHGKPCPNRPFPGHGKGVMRILGISPDTLSRIMIKFEKPEGGGPPRHGGPDQDSTAAGDVTLTVSNNTDSSISDSSTQKGLGHVKGHGRGHGRGHAIGLDND